MTTLAGGTSPVTSWMASPSSGIARAMLAAPVPDDYVIATGELHSVKELVELAFSHVGLDWERLVQVDAALDRGRGTVANLVGDASRARVELDWMPTVTFETLIRTMVDADLADLSA